MNPQYLINIKAILFDKEISNAERMELLRIKIATAFE